MAQSFATMYKDKPITNLMLASVATGLKESV
jgi:hypothetical protein